MIENEIFTYLEGKEPTEVNVLLARAASELTELRAKVAQQQAKISDLGWAVEFEQNRADAFDPRYT